MVENSAIEWCDHTFNPWIGCTKVSPGCDYCYAEGLATARLGVKWGPLAERRRTAASTWKRPLTWNRKAAAAGERHRVFCASLADVFDNAVDVHWRRDLAALILMTPHLDWLLLTKRIGNAAEMLADMFPAGVQPNVWLGATIVNQVEADRDIPKLLATKQQCGVAKVFLSMEPLLGPVDLAPEADRTYQMLSEWYGPDGFDPTGSQPRQTRMRNYFPRVDWVIVGGESGSHARPIHPDWARSLRDQCAVAGVPFLFKQWGEWLPCERVEVADGARDCPDQTIEEGSSSWALAGHGREATIIRRVGKKAAGRLLDSVQHDGVPA